MNVNISGTVLSSLFFEHGNSDSDLDGFLLGRIGSQVTDSISDSHIKTSTEKTTCYIYSYVLSRKPCTWYDAGGRIRVDELKQILSHGNAGRERDVVGWYKFRRNSTMKPSLREQAIHCNLSDCFPGVIPQNFLFLLCTPQCSSNKSTHDMDHIFQVKNGRAFEALPVTIVNLGDTVNAMYKFEGSSTVSARDGPLTRTLEHHSADFVANDGRLHSVLGVQTLSGTLQKQLQHISKTVVGSELELKRLRQDIRLLKARLKPKPEVKPEAPPGRGSKSLLQDEGTFQSLYSRSFEGSTSSSSPFSPGFPLAAEPSYPRPQQFSVDPDVLKGYPQDKNPFVPSKNASSSSVGSPEVDLISLRDSDEDNQPAKKLVQPPSRKGHNDTKLHRDKSTGRSRKPEYDDLSDSDLPGLEFQLHGPEMDHPILQPQRSFDSDKSNSTHDAPKNNVDAFDFVNDLMTKPVSSSRNTRAQNQAARSQNLKAPKNYTRRRNQNTLRPGVAEAIELSSSDEDQPMDYQANDKVLSNSPMF